MAKEKKKDKNIKKKTYVALYYMLQEEVSAKRIAQVLVEGYPDYSEKLECWDEAGVLEILVGEDSSVDLECLVLSEAELEEDFLVSNHVKCVYSVHTDSEQMQEVKRMFTHIVSKLGGILCSDSADFMPVIVKVV